MPIVFPYGFTLDSSKTVEVWDMKLGSDDSRSDDSDNYIEEYRLMIKTVMLGSEARIGEFNVLQVEAEGLTGSFTVPIAVLKMTEIPHIHLDLCYKEPMVTFTLIKGSGPIHILGHNLIVKRRKDMENVDDTGELENIENLENMRVREDVEDIEESGDSEDKENERINFNNEDSIMNVARNIKQESRVIIKEEVDLQERENSLDK